MTDSINVVFDAKGCILKINLPENKSPDPIVTKIDIEGSDLKATLALWGEDGKLHTAYLDDIQLTHLISLFYRCLP